ncbi:MAG: hypothetical protein ACREFG_02105, partial [Chthoniobacterales bacterium]
MSVPPHLVSLNLGSQTLRLAIFEAQAQGGPVMIGYRQREILADPATESDRPRQITAALLELISDLGIKGGQVNYALSAQSVFARFVKLPP